MSAKIDAMDFYLKNVNSEFKIDNTIYTGFNLANEIDNESKIGSIAVNSYVFRAQNDREFAYFLNSDDKITNID